LKLAGYHLKAANSGIISPNFHENLQIMNEINIALKFSKLKKRIIIIGHLPCGFATAKNLTIYDCIELMIRGRSAILQQFKEFDINVSVAVQVDYRTLDETEKVQNTYHIETSMWEDFKAKNNCQFSDNLFGRAKAN